MTEQPQKRQQGCRTPKAFLLRLGGCKMSPRKCPFRGGKWVIL